MNKDRFCCNCTICQLPRHKQGRTKAAALASLERLARIAGSVTSQRSEVDHHVSFIAGWLLDVEDSSEA